MSRLAKPLLLLSFAVSLLGAANANALACTSVGTGSWSAPATWTAAGNCNRVPTTADSVTIQNGHTVTLAANAALVNLTINTGGTLNLATFRMRPTGTVSLSGTLNLGTNTGTRFAGLVAINAGGIWANASAPVSFSGGLTNNGTFNGGTGTQTFDTSQALGGGNAIVFGGIVAVVGATVTNNNTGGVTIAGNLTGSNASSTWVNAANSTLNYGGATAPMGTRLFTASAAGNTVNYTGAAQTVKAPSGVPASYYHLTLSGGGVKTLPATAMTVAGNLTLSGTASATATAAVLVGGNFSLGATSTFANSTFAFNVAGNIAQNGTFNAGTGVFTLNGAAAQTISGTGPLGFANLTVSNPAGITLTRNVTVTRAVTGAVTLTATCPADYTLTSNGGATVAHSCSSNVQACFTDTFTGANGAPGANWSTSSNSGAFGPAVIFNNRLRLTDASANVDTFAALQRQFPGAGNKIVVDFDHFAYGGSGADGIAVVLSDAAVVPVPGGYGGSLGYANRNAPAVVAGFAGGWLGVGIDEYGNFSAPTEGRSGGPGVVIDSVAVRGSGAGQLGYAFHAGTATLALQVDNNGAAAPPHHYRITIDHSNGINAWVTVERNTGAGYVVLVPAYDAKAKAGQAAVPANWMLSFTGSTGSSTNIHEIDNLSVCATLPIAPYTPPTVPGDFNTFDTATAAGALDGVIQTKIAGKPFTLDIAVLNTAKTAYLTTLTGAVKVELLNSSNNAGILDANSCMSTWSLLQALPGATFPAPNSGRLTLAAITVPDAWQDVRVRVSYPATGTPTKIGCSTDNFAIRPNSLANLVLSDANWTTAGTTQTLNNTGASGGVTHKAGQPFTVRAVALNAAAATAANYAGTPAALLTACAGTACTATLGTFSMGAGAAVAGQVNSNTATYSEVGAFTLQLQDTHFADVDLTNPLDATPKDCTATGGWICSAVLDVGRFVPDHFNVAYNVPVFMPAIASDIDSYSYIGQAFDFAPGAEPVLTISAMGAGGNVTGNYTAGTVGATPGALWKLNNGFIASQVWTDVSAAPCAACPLVVNGRAVVVGTSDVLAAGTGTASFSLTGAYYTRPASPVAAFDASLRLSGGLGVDGDGVAAASPTYQFAAVGFNANTASTADARMRYGRTMLSNAYGSELLPLSIAATGQYWDGAAYLNSITDSQTRFVVATPPAGLVAFGNYKNPLAAVAVEGSPNTVTLLNGVVRFNLAAPGAGNNGSVEMTIPVLIGAGCDVFPTPLGCYLPTTTAARATFGVYGGKTVFIYRGRHGR